MAEGLCPNGCCAAGFCKCNGGKYEETVSKVPIDDKLPLKELPKGPDPSPFTLGPMGGGR